MSTFKQEMYFKTGIYRQNLFRLALLMREELFCPKKDDLSRRYTNVALYSIAISYRSNTRTNIFPAKRYQFPSILESHSLYKRIVSRFGRPFHDTSRAIYESIRSFQIRRRIRFGSAAEERDEGVDGHAEGMAERAQEESLSDQGREDHACDHYEDDTDAGVHLVRERAAASEKREQNDLGAEKQNRR